MKRLVSDVCIFVREKEHLPVAHFNSISFNEEQNKSIRNKLRPTYFMVYCHWCPNNWDQTTACSEAKITLWLLLFLRQIKIKIIQLKLVASEMFFHVILLWKRTEIYFSSNSL